ncbi:hypothetical protein V2A60_010033 [Cordyceps javanica]|uniref:Uncharacterized protein n=1 Tax=Cordyceps javanica TaxID=43265 RepID=A0A545VTP6_9HYPO|nr:hypothetical protein IF1G_08148 [Cordyceps javanica]TQW05093.1 tubulin/FtsZ family, GTPase domain-containing protein [Cordyceps javanica]
MSSPTSNPAAQPVSRRQYSRHGPSAGPDGNTQQANNSHTHGALPLSFRLPFQTNSTSASLVPSVAEGRPIPVDDSTAEHRTEALREYNSHYPSRHRYAKSTGAENTTYSEPVIVRSYYRPPPNRANRMPRGNSSSSSSAGIIVVRNGHSTAGSVNGSVASRTRASPFTGKMASASSGMLSIMARARGQNPQFVNRSLPEDSKLPPIEAFSFKSFLENLDEQENTATSSDINADLDRIAEICARSRYSLSNQYEVHYGPHGSGNSFIAEGYRGTENHGPTLQAITSDDETNTRTERKRRLGGRRNSRAMGTLETIMSSSRSSDDDNSKKKSAAEIADDVRGRVSTKTSHHTSPAGSTTSARERRTPQELTKQRPTVKRTLSSSLALIDNKPTVAPPTGAEVSTSHGASIVSLVGEPALPLPSASQLEVHTASSATNTATVTNIVPVIACDRPHQPSSDRTGNPLPCPATKGAASLVDGTTATGFLSTLAGWIPWGSGSSAGGAGALPQQGRAAGSLRNLLKEVEHSP